MVVEKGYKQTEVGVIPISWEFKELNDLIDSDRSIRYGIVQPGKFDLYGRYLVRGQDYSFGWASPDTLFKVSSTIEEKYKNARLRKGDLILTIVGAGTGHVATVPDWLDGSNITQTTARIPIDRNKANSDYIKYYLHSTTGKKIISNFIKGAAQPGLNIGDVRIFAVILPPLPEQTAIATALSDMDALIAQTEKLIEKNKAIKQGVMQELLKPKEGWVTKKLGEVCEIKKGTQMNRSILKSADDYPVINGGVLPSGYTSLWNQIENTVVISEGGNSCGYVNLIKTKFWQGGHCYSLKSDLNNDYLFQLLKSIEVKIMALRVGSGLPNIQRNRLSSLVINIPSIEEQNTIASILSNQDMMINILENKLQKLRLQKQGMMQALLTGKIRLI
jgi:type I restriction enzyme S subunit